MIVFELRMPLDEIASLAKALLSSVPIGIAAQIVQIIIKVMALLQEIFLEVKFIRHCRYWIPYYNNNYDRNFSRFQYISIILSVKTSFCTVRHSKTIVIIPSSNQLLSLYIISNSIVVALEFEGQRRNVVQTPREDDIKVGISFFDLIGHDYGLLMKKII